MDIGIVQVTSRGGMGKVTVALVIVIVLLLLASLLFTAAYVNRANHTWCSTLILLTQHPVPKPADPAANPSRVTAYHYYSVFLAQRHRLGCG